MNLNEIIKKVTCRADLDMYDNASYMDMWLEWYKGKVASFHNYRIWTGKRFVPMERFTLAMAKKSCEDWANLLINEKTDIVLANQQSQDKLNDIFENCNFWRKANDGIEKTFALGCGAFVVSVNDLLVDSEGNLADNKNAKVKISFIQGKKVRPLTFEDGDITECAFVAVGNKRTTVAVHLKDDDGIYKIHQFQCDGISEDRLTILPDTYEIFDTQSRSPWFYVVRPNIANNIDLNSPLGISVYANSIDILKEIDLVFDSYQNEFSLGRKRIFINARATTIDKDGEREVFDSNDVAFYVLPEADSDDGVFIKTDTQPLRVSDHQAALQNLLNLYSYACGFGTNHYKFDDGSIATATQVISENSDLFRNLKKHEIIIEECLKTIVKAVVYAVNTFTTDNIDGSTIEIKFDDSIIEDKQGEKANDRLDVSMGVISKAEYRAKWYGEDEATARAKIDEIDNFTIPDTEPYSEGGDGESA